MIIIRSPLGDPHFTDVKSIDKTGTSDGIDEVGFGRRPFPPMFYGLERRRDSFTGKTAFTIDRGASLPSPLCLSKLPIDPGLLRQLPALSLPLQLGLTRLSSSWVFRRIRRRRQENA